MKEIDGWKTWLVPNKKHGEERVNEEKKGCIHLKAKQTPKQKKANGGRKEHERERETLSFMLMKDSKQKQLKDISAFKPLQFFLNNARKL